MNVIKMIWSETGEEILVSTAPSPVTLSPIIVLNELAAKSNTFPYQLVYVSSTAKGKIMENMFLYTSTLSIEKLSFFTMKLLSAHSADHVKRTYASMVNEGAKIKVTDEFIFKPSDLSKRVKTKGVYAAKHPTLYNTGTGASGNGPTLDTDSPLSFPGQSDEDMQVIVDTDDNKNPSIIAQAKGGPQYIFSLVSGTPQSNHSYHLGVLSSSGEAFHSKRKVDVNCPVIRAIGLKLMECEYDRVSSTPPSPGKTLTALDFILTLGEHQFTLKHSLGTTLTFNGGRSHTGETKFSLTFLVLSNTIAEEDIETAEERREFDAAHAFVESLLKFSQGKDVIVTLNYDIYLEGESIRVDTDMDYFGKTDLHTFFDFIGCLKIHGYRPHLRINNSEMRK